MTLKQIKSKLSSRLLSKWITQKYPTCILCGKPSELAHHHIHESKSIRLRYEESNLIPLCKGCHFKLHQDESYWACKILSIKGMVWFNTLDTLRNEKVKANKAFYKRHLDRIRKEVSQ